MKVRPSVKPMCDGCKDLVNWIMEDNLNVRVQIQLHKILNAKQKEVNANELWK